MSTRSAVAYSFLDRYAALALSIASSVILSRLMTPSEIGVYSITMVFVSFAAAFRDLGAGQFLLQKRDLDQRHLRAVWTVMLGAGLLMAGVIYAGSAPLASFYGEPQIVTIMTIISASYVVNSFGAMSYAWLMRGMRFEALALMRFSATLIGTAITLILAWLNHGPISLAWGVLGSSATNAAFGLFHRPANFNWLPSRSDLKEVISFGSKVSLTSVTNVLTNGAPEMVLGKLQGLHAVGIFSRANGLAAMFNRLVMDATHAVALPLFAKSTRESGSSSEYWLIATAYMTVLGWSFAAGIACLGEPLVLLLYGPQWSEAIPILSFLALAMSISLPAALCPQALLGAGQAGRVLRITGFSAVFQISGSVAGSYFSPTAAALGLALAQIPSTLLWLSETKKYIGFKWYELFQRLRLSLACSALVAIVPMMITLTPYTKDASPALQILGASIVGAAVLLLALRLLRHPLWHECLTTCEAVRSRLFAWSRPPSS